MSVVYIMIFKYLYIHVLWLCTVNCWQGSCALIVLKNLMHVTAAFMHAYNIGWCEKNIILLSEK